MPRAELYFMAAMMALILVVSLVTVFFFVKQYRKEMQEKEVRNAKKNAEKAGR